MISSTARNGTPCEDKLPQALVIPDVDPADDLSETLSQFESIEEVQQLTETIRPDCLEILGLIGDIIQHNLRTAYYPHPKLALAGALALMSSVTGGNPGQDESVRDGTATIGWR